MDVNFCPLQAFLSIGRNFWVLGGNGRNLWLIRVMNLEPFWLILGHFGLLWSLELGALLRWYAPPPCKLLCTALHTHFTLGIPLVHEDSKILLKHKVFFAIGHVNVDPSCPLWKMQCRIGERSWRTRTFQTTLNFFNLILVSNTWKHVLLD